jgi:hypothetical protein
MVTRERMSVVVQYSEVNGVDNELAFWLSRPVAERIEAVEVLRQRDFGGADGVRPGRSFGPPGSQASVRTRRR